MALTVRKGKVNRHEKITQVLLSANQFLHKRFSQYLKAPTKRQFCIACQPTFTISAKMAVS